MRGGLYLLTLLCVGPAYAEDLPAVVPGCDPAQVQLALADGRPAAAACGDLTFAFGRNIGGKAAGTTYIAFTFDDGPRPETTPAILDTLDRYGVVGTFFVVGQRVAGSSKSARRNAEILADIVKRGHDVGNHTYRHKVCASSQ